MAYVVNRMRFRALRAHRVREAGFFSWVNFFCRDGSNEVSHAPGRGLEVRLVPQTGRQTDRENGHYENIYIDNCIFSADVINTGQSWTAVVLTNK